MYLGFSSLGFPLPLVESKGEAPHSSHRAGISSVLFSCGNAFILLFFSITPTVLFLSAGRVKRTKKRARCTLRCRRNVNSKHCAAGLATLKQVLAPPKGAVLSRCISLLHLTSSNSLMLGIVQVNLALPSLNRDFPAIETLRAPSNSPEGGEPLPSPPRKGGKRSLARGDL